jgi:phage terminase large subunit-like protein
MKGFTLHPELDGLLKVRHLELRYDEDRRLLRVAPSEGARVHGLSSSLYIGDEVWAWLPNGELLEAMQTGLLKRPDAKFLGISTAAAQLDSPLGRMRARALAQPYVKRNGAVLEARGDLHWLEWSLPDDASLEDFDAVKACNPAPYITLSDLRRQRAALPSVAFAQFHACRWGVGEGSWLPPGAWQECVGQPTFTMGEPIWVGVDVGAERSASAVAWVNEQLHADVAIYHGAGAILEVIEHVRSLAHCSAIRELAYDPWRFGQAALELEREGLQVVEFPQTDVRMIPASHRLHAAIVEHRITLPDDSELARHASDAIARHGRRGWRIDKPRKEINIDAIVALAMAVDRAEHQPAPVELLGWL